VWLPALSAAMLAGCAVGPDFVRPGRPKIDRYTYDAPPGTTISADGRAQRFEPGGRVAVDWWRLFKSPQLDAVIAEAMASSPTVQAAQASLRRSQETLRAGYGVFFPQIDGGFDVTRQRYNPIRVGQTLTKSSIFNLFTLSATVSYALDLFGGQRRAVESLRAQADVQGYTVQATYLTLSGNMVNTVIARAAYAAQIQATDELIGMQREQLRITETQAEAGTVPYSNVLSLQSQLAATEATLPPLRQKLAQTEHLLATLAGRAPGEWRLGPIGLTDITLPGDLPVTLPSELVRQRPDILVAEAQLHRSSAEIGVATAALFPSLTLNGSYGVSNTTVGDLFKDASAFWSYGATVGTPLFHGGTLWFQRKAAIEAYQQSLASYRQTVLSAFAQVADTLRGLEHDAEAVEAQSRAMGAAEGALRLIQANYEAGTANYLQVLVADGQYQQARIGYLQAVAQRLQDTVGLFVALGGGWRNMPEWAPASNSATVGRASLERPGTRDATGGRAGR
jgi:NodT family efflux transporter outer membrane factor (OMF) lipoprotein